MNKTWLSYLVLLSVLFIACDETEDLTPSLKDTDRVTTQLDLSNPIIKKLKDDFNLGLLYEYNDTLDFTYTAENYTAAIKWGGVEIPQLKSRFFDEEGNFPTDSIDNYQLYVEEALTFVDTTLFRYFSSDGLIATKMPYKVLLSESIYSSLEVHHDPITESESRINYPAVGGLRTVYNNHSIVINVNQDDVTSSPDITKMYMKDNFFIFLSRIMEMHNLYELVPFEFYEGKDVYYGQEMDAIYRDEKNIGEEKNVYVIDKDWFYKKGFVDAKYFYGSSYSGLGTVYQFYDENGDILRPYLIHKNGIRPSYEFVAGVEKDVRSYLNEMIHRNEIELNAFPDKIKNNMRLLIEMFEGWGVKIVAFNPDLEVLKEAEEVDN